MRRNGPVWREIAESVGRYPPKNRGVDPGDGLKPRHLGAR